MQKVITVRASQRDLKKIIDEFLSRGWCVVSVTKGSDLRRVGFSFTWTIVLDTGENDANADKLIAQAKDYGSKISWAKAIGVTLIISVVLVLIVVIAVV